MPRKSSKSKKTKTSNTSRKRRSGTRNKKHPFLLLFVLVAAAGFLPYSHSAITSRVRTIVEDVSDGACGIEKATFTPFLGITLKKATLTRGLDKHSHMKIDIPYVMVRYSPFRILVNRKRAITHLSRMLRSGEYTYLDSLIDDGLAGIRAKNARVAILRSRGDNLVAQGVHAKIGVRQVEGTKVGGWFKVDRFQNGPFTVENLRSDVKIEGSKIVVDNLKGGCYRGRLGGAITLDGRSKTVRGGTLSIRNMELAHLYADYPNKVGELHGKADIRMRLRKSSWAPDHLRGRGELSAQDVYADRIPLLNTIVTTLTLPRLKTLQFRDLKADVTLRGRTIAVSNLRGRGEPMDITGTGSIDEESRMDLKVEGFFPETFRDSLSPLAWNALFPDEKKNGRKFVCRVQGTYDNPWITVDRKHTRRAVKKVFTSIGQSIGAAFRRDKDAN